MIIIVSSRLDDPDLRCLDFFHAGSSDLSTHSWGPFLLAASWILFPRARKLALEPEHGERFFQDVRGLDSGP